MRSGWPRRFVCIATVLLIGCGTRVDAQQGRRIVFPTIEGRNLERREVRLPADFAGERNIVLVAFKQWQQREVNSWLPALTSMRREARDLEVYEIPTLNRGWTPLRGWIDSGMRSGIADQATRETTITVYINKGPFKSALGISSESAIEVLLLDGAGAVMHRERGRASPQGVRRLREALGLPATAP